MNQFRSAHRQMRFWAPLSVLACALFSGALAWSQEPQEPQEPTQEAEAPQEARPEQPPRYGSRAERDRALLAARFPQETQWLELPQEEALALYRPAESASPKGALLLLHSADNPPHWPIHLDNLRRALPRHGWATLALTLPLADRPAIPPRPEETLPQAGDLPIEGEEPLADEKPLADDEEPTAADEEPLPEEEPLPPRAERIANHLEASLNWLQQEGHSNLIILTDPASAPEVMAHLAPQLTQGTQAEPTASGESPLPGPIRALVLVSTRAGHELDRTQLEAVFAVPDLPVLDVFLGPSTRIQKRRREHRDASRRQQLNHYQQLELRTPDIHDPEDETNRWARRIHSYMVRQAEGVKAPVNRVNRINR